MKLKILLLVILLALVPQVSADATIFINQTTSTNSYVINGNTHWANQSFTTYNNWKNLSRFKLDYIEVYGTGNNPAKVFVSNDTYTSEVVTFTIGAAVQYYRANFTGTFLEQNSVYYFNVSSADVNPIVINYDTTNPYAGGRAFNDAGTFVATDDLRFNIGLQPFDNVGNWTMNQGTGNYANDSTPFFNNGTIFDIPTGTVTWSTNLVNGSVNGTALQFGGTNNEVNITQNATINISSAQSFTGWIKPNKITGVQRIIEKGGTNWEYSVFINGASAGDLNYVTYNPAGSTHSGTVGSGYSNNTWTFISGTYQDGVIQKVYINNILIGSTTTFSGTATSPGIDPLRFGSRTNTTDYYSGSMDEFKLYNYALNTSELTAEYQRFQPVPAYPVGGLNIPVTSATTYVNFSWHDTVYPQDELIIATDSGFANVIHDAFHSTDYANLSLTVGTTYYWKVRQFDAGTGSFGNTSAIQTFTLGSVPTFIRVNVFDELNQTPLININATLTSIATNVSVNLSSSGSYVNFTNPNITDGVEYLAQVGALGYTTRNILISAPGNYSIYLPYTATPTGVSQINFVESDYTGLFPYQSTKLIVQKVINTTLVNISSNYFDATGLSTAQLINGQLYQLVVESTVSTRVLGSFIPTASATQTLLIASFTLLPSGPFNELVYNFTYNSNQSIVLQWSDPNNEIISLNETITNQLNVIVLQLITSVHSGQTTYLIANTSSKYLVQLNISTVHYGYLLYSLWYNPNLFTSSNASVAPTPGPNNYIIPFGNTTAIGNQSNANAPIPQWVKNFFSVSFLVVMALILNREHVARGMVLVSAFSLVFWVTGMLVFDIGYIATGGVLGALFIITIVNMLSEANRS